MLREGKALEKKWSETLTEPEVAQPRMDILCFVSMQGKTPSATYPTKAPRPPLWGLPRPWAPGIFSPTVHAGLHLWLAAQRGRRLSLQQSQPILLSQQSYLRVIIKPLRAMQLAWSWGRQRVRYCCKCPCRKRLTLARHEPRDWLWTSSEFGDGRSLQDRFPREESKGSWWQLWPSRA